MARMKTSLSEQILDHARNLSRSFYEEISNRTSDVDDDPEIAIFAWWVCHVVAVSKFGAEKIQDELNMAQGMLTKLLAARSVELGLLSDRLDDDEKFTQIEVILHEANNTYAAASQRAVGLNEKWNQIAREFVTRLELSSMNGRAADSLANAMSALASDAYNEVNESLQVQGLRVKVRFDSDFATGIIYKES